MTGLSPLALETRRHRIGASEIAAVLGISPYAGPFDVFARICHGLTRDDSPELTVGRYLERATLDWYDDAQGCKTERNCAPRVHPVHDFLSCTPDARNVTVNVQAKTDRDRNAWGEPGTDQVPVHVAAQVQGEMAVLECEVTHVPVYFKGSDLFALYIVPRDEAVIAHILAATGAWFEKHVTRGEMPALDGGNAAAAYLKQRYPGGGPLVKATPEQAALVGAYAAGKAAVKEMTKQNDVLKQRIALELGDANGWEGLCTYKPNVKGVRSLRLAGEKE